jgi:serine/threonine-protein kinase HipA
MSRQARVYYRDRPAGTLSELPEGGYRFVYDPAYLEVGPAIALTLPLQAAPLESRELFPFFAGLVPEGWYLRIVAPTIKVDETDTFGPVRTASVR